MVSPACAGMIPVAEMADRDAWREPRMRGDDPYFLRPRKCLIR